uniref:Uncharacterized protein n=1 Tax=Avena sativa TaxID=4498 RepID=A0ACD5ZT50_AVESA
MPTQETNTTSGHPAIIDEEARIRAKLRLFRRLEDNIFHNFGAIEISPGLSQILRPPLELAKSLAAGVNPELVGLFFSFCLSSDHQCSACRLAPPAAPLAIEEEEEEDPEELVFEDGSSEEGAQLSQALDGMDGNLQAADDDGFIPLVDAADYLPAPDDQLVLPDAEDLEEPQRPDYIDVFMPFINMAHFDNLAFAFLNPSLENPDNFIYQAADLGCGPDRVSLFPSYRGARLAVFSSPYDRENAVHNGPFLGREATVFFECHDESDNRFLFEHDALAALSIEDFPLEHWNREHIIHSSTPMPIPTSLILSASQATGSIGKVDIIGFDDLAPGSGHSFGPDSDPVPEAFSSDDEHQIVEIEGGAGYAEVLQALGAPLPLVDHAEPSSAEPAAALSAVSQALVAAPDMPMAIGDPLRSKPKSVVFKLYLGFFDVHVLGSLGEQAFFRLPMRPLSPDPGCKGLMVVNLATASVGLISSIAMIGPLNRLTLTVDVLVRGRPTEPALAVPIPFATELALGHDAHLPLVPDVVPVAASLIAAQASADARPLAAAPGAPTTAIHALALEVTPVLPTVWQAISPPPRPRCSSRLASMEPSTFVSIVDKGSMRKKDLMEGTAQPKGRKGELNAHDLLAVAVEAHGPLLDQDIQSST